MLSRFLGVVESQRALTLPILFPPPSDTQSGATHLAFLLSGHHPTPPFHLSICMSAEILNIAARGTYYA